jgi:GNAT superfamily N-acetyltransferase
MEYEIRRLDRGGVEQRLAVCIAAVWEKPADPARLDQIISDNLRLWDSRPDVMLLGAIAEDGSLVGFRLGHAWEADPSILYDQHGGVVPLHRRRGVGRMLLREQHRLAREHGYHAVRTGVAISLKPMLLLNLQEGFDVVDVGWDASNGVKVIWLEKVLR